MTTIDATGFSRTTYADRLTALQAKYQSVYGADASIDPSTPDGQFLAVLAEAISSVDQTAEDTNSIFDPDTSTGVALARLARLAAISKLEGTFSLAAVTLAGAPNQILNSPRIANGAGTEFDFEGAVTLDGTGAATILATSLVPGMFDVSAQPAQILNPQQGWESATIIGGTTGSPTESDPALRARRYQSTSKVSQNLDDALFAAISNIKGVTDCLVYDNRSNATDGAGVPAHAVLVVVDGTDGATNIGQKCATTTWSKLGPGVTLWATSSLTQMNGTTTPYVVQDSQGHQQNVPVYRPTDYPIYLQVNGLQRTGWPSNGAALIAAACAAFVATKVRIGGTLELLDLVPGILAAVPGFACESLLWSTSGGGSFTSSRVNVDAFSKIRLSAAHVTVIAA